MRLGALVFAFEFVLEFEVCAETAETIMPRAENKTHKAINQSGRVVVVRKFMGNRMTNDETRMTNE